MQEGFFTTNTVNVLQLQQWLRGSCKGSALVPRTYVRPLTTYNSHARRADLFRPPQAPASCAPPPLLHTPLKIKIKLMVFLGSPRKRLWKAIWPYPKSTYPGLQFFFITILIKYLCMKGVLFLCWQTSQSFFLKDIYNVFWSSPSIFLPLKLLSDLPQHVSLSTSYSHLFFLSFKSNWTWMWGYSPERGQLTCGHSPKKNDSPSHRNYQLPIAALVEVDSSALP